MTTMNRVIGLFVVVGVSCGVSWGIINPNFTPKHLVEQADVIFAGTLAPGEGAAEWKLSVARQIKGKSAAVQVISLAQCHKDHAKDIEEALRANRTGPVVLYSGTLNEEKRAYAHVNGLWLDVKAGKKDRWHVLGYAAHMSGTYAGGTDMLIRMSTYIAEDPDSDVPVTAGVRWMENTKLGKVAGKIGGLAAVEIAQGKKSLRHLFVASSAGDRLYRAKKDAESFEDVTAAAKVDTKSRRFVWMDLDGDGQADLLTWDGTALSARLVKGGKFTPCPPLARKLDAGCLALAACSTDGRAGVLVSTHASPLLLVAETAKKWKKIDMPGGMEEHFGQASPCVVADLDGDGYVDVLQPAESAAVLWKGKPGGFAKPVRSPVASGSGAALVAVGDYDENGSLDIFLVGPERNSLWENDGKANFKEVFRYSGSMSYKCPAGATDVKAMDLNHDGRQDLCLVYAGSDILYHWNRGFRAFGEEGEVRLPGTEVEPGQPRIGQRAVVAGDFNGDGSLDLAVALTNGEVRCYFNEQMDMPALRLRLPKGVTGPVTASCWMGEKFPVCTGTLPVAAHAPETYVTARYPGKCTIRYRLPGKPPRADKVAVADGAKPWVIGAPEKKPPPKK